MLPHLPPARESHLSTLEDKVLWKHISHWSQTPELFTVEWGRGRLG